MSTAPSSISLIILAAGLGSRFGGNKQLAEIPQLNRTIFELSIYDAYQAGIRHLVLVINEQILEVIQQQILPRIPKKMTVDLAIQTIEDLPVQYLNYGQTRTKPWGTGHALLAAKDIIRDKAIVITADDYYGKQAYTDLCQQAAKSDDWAMLAYPLKQTLSSIGGVNRGICQLDNNGYLASIFEVLNISQQKDHYIGFSNNEAMSLSPSMLVSMTIWLVDKRFFPLLEHNFTQFLANYQPENQSEYFLPDQIQAAINQKLAKMNVLTAQDNWLGVTYKDEFIKVSHQLRDIFTDTQLEA